MREAPQGSRRDQKEVTETRNVWKRFVCLQTSSEKEGEKKTCCTRPNGLYAKGRVCHDLGIYFMNNRSGLPPEGGGGAEEQHLHGIKSVERMEEI